MVGPVALSRRSPRPTTGPVRPGAGGPSRAVTACSRAARRRDRDHQRSSAGHGPAQPDSGSHGPPSTDSRSGAAVSRPRADTRTASPRVSARSARIGSGWTTAGAGGGIRPGHGAPARRRLPGAAPPGRLPVVQVTRRDCSAGLRPPWRWAVTTPSGPRSSWAATRQRAARASASLTPPQNPTSATTGASGASSPASSRARRGWRRSASSPLRPPATRWARAPSAPNRPRMSASGRAANSPSVRMPRRSSSSARSGWPRMPTGSGARNARGPPGRYDLPRRAASTAANSPSATPTSAGETRDAASWTRSTRASSPPK